MPGLAAEIRGVDQLVDSLERFARDLAELTAAKDRAGSLVAAVARRTAPRLTGALAETVDATATGSLVEVTAGGGRVTYAPAVHRRNPWMKRASEATADDVVRIYADEVKRLAAKIEGS